MRFLISLLIVAAIIQAQPVIAEEARRGRTADGQAYRLDSEGNQLVDYIAELEVNIDSLNRQVQGLESENQEKQALIDGLKAGVTQVPVKEKDLTAAVVPVKALECQPKIIEKECPPTPLSVTCPPQDCTVASNAEIAKCDQRIEDIKIDKDLIIQKQSGEMQKLKAQMVAMQADLQLARKDSKNTKEQLASALKESQKVEAPSTTRSDFVENVKSEESLQATERASLKLDSSQNSVVRIEAASNAALNQSRIQAVDVLRSRMLNDLGSLQDLITYRDGLYQDAVRHSANVEEPVPVYDEVATLKQMVKEAARVSDLSALRTNVNELRGKVQGEIALLKRVQK